MNEKGLCIAGLNFVRSAEYTPARQGKANIAQFELIPWILGRCATADEACELLRECHITDDAFLPGMTTAKLHWLLADRKRCVVVEQTAEGLHIYENPAGVLTNEPPFPVQQFSLNNYAHLSPNPPENRFAPALPLEEYSRGMGAMGLPGDLSSQSRFIRTAFTRMNSRSGADEGESVSQLCHILGAAAQQRGCCVLADGAWQGIFKARPDVLSAEEKKAWIAAQSGVTVGSDAFFPFGDNVERARKSGVCYIAEPGGSIRDDNVIATADKYGMVLVFTGARLFHH